MFLLRVQVYCTIPYNHIIHELVKLEIEDIDFEK